MNKFFVLLHMPLKLLPVQRYTRVSLTQNTVLWKCYNPFFTSRNTCLQQQYNASNIPKKIFIISLVGNNFHSKWNMQVRHASCWLKFMRVVQHFLNHCREEYYEQLLFFKFIMCNDLKVMKLNFCCVLNTP